MPTRTPEAGIGSCGPAVVSAALASRLRNTGNFFDRKEIVSYSQFISAPPAAEDLARQLAVLEERMKTMQAEYKTDIALMSRQLSQQIAYVRADVARRGTEAAKRDKDNLRWQVGLWVATIVVLGTLVTWAAS